MSDVLQKPSVKTFLLQDDGSIPNNPNLPLLVYAGALALPSNDPARPCEVIFESNQWGGGWRNGIYPFHHYHSTAHEVLAIAKGTAKVQFGGQEGPVIDVQPGDVVIIPAGVGHKNLGSSADLLVVGAYPSGQSWDMCRGSADERPEALDNITNVPLPERDPVYGEEGPLVTHWLQGPGEET